MAPELPSIDDDKVVRICNVIPHKLLEMVSNNF